MNDQLTLPDGTVVGTGLVAHPVGLVSTLPVYEDVGPVLTPAEIEAAARSGRHRGRDRFDQSFIKNQRSHGSCNGFAGAAALTRARVRRGLGRVDLSGAYLYSLINGGRDQGSMLDDGMRAVQARGVATEATVGWDQIYPRQYDRSRADAEAARHRAFECYAVRTREGLLSALACDFDCVVAVHAGGRFMRLDGRGVAGADRGRGNHAVCADGLHWDGEVLVDSPGSWGTTYGDGGRCYLSWDGHLAPTTDYHVFYAIRSTLDGSQP